MEDDGGKDSWYRLLMDTQSRDAQSCVRIMEKRVVEGINTQWVLGPCRRLVSKYTGCLYADDYIESQNDEKV